MMFSKSPQFDDSRVAASESGPIGFVPSSPEEAELSRRVNRKMDFAMLPLLSLVYLFNGLDKGNIGNAETQGMLLIYVTGNTQSINELISLMRFA